MDIDKNETDHYKQTLNEMNRFGCDIYAIFYLEMTFIGSIAFMTLFLNI